MNKDVEQLAKQMRNAYAKKWRLENKDKVKKHQKEYWKRKAEEKIEHDKVSESTQQ